MPSSLVWPMLCVLVSVWVMVICAPGTTARDGSATFPEMIPVSICANTAVTAARKTERTNSKRRFIGIPLLCNAVEVRVWKAAAEVNVYHGLQRELHVWTGLRPVLGRHRVPAPQLVLQHVLEERHGARIA